jgi:hypothetical protein
MQQLSDEAQQLIEMLSKLEADGFFGSVELKFEAGRIVLCRKSENIKFNSPRGPRGDRNGAFSKQQAVYQPSRR